MRIVLTSLLWLVVAVSQACETPGTGDPDCAGKGNPINVINGNKFQRDVDLPALPGVMGLEIVRYYNSKLSRIGVATGILGRGWKLGYESELRVFGSTLQLTRADGKVLMFGRDPMHAGQFLHRDPAYGMVEQKRVGHGNEYIWRQLDGTQWHFNTQGKLVQMLAPTGEFVSLQYDHRGWLVKVTDPQARSLSLNYLPQKEWRDGRRFRGVQSIDSPVGRFTYGYGSALPAGAAPGASAELVANLNRVGMPGKDGTARLYHHEDPRFPTLLTGISVVDDKTKSQRISTFGYDGSGRAILSTHAQDVDKITLDFRADGETVLTNSLGQKTVYKYGHAGDEPRLLEARGAGCSLCGDTNVRYGYDRWGRMTEVTRLDRNGAPLLAMRTEYDYYGRPIKFSRVNYTKGRPGPAEWWQRFEYAANTRTGPALIARPSVVPGREVRVRLQYNEHGQPIAQTSSGWQPSIDGKGPPVAIERTVHYRYKAINNRSLLTAIDGPLANGKKGTPEDSDVIDLEWNKDGSVILASLGPGRPRTEFQYDAAGRVNYAHAGEGNDMRIVYDFRGNPLEIAAGNGANVMHYDAEGKLIEAGSRREGKYTATSRYGYDDAGRNVWIASALGIIRHQQFDTEGNLLETATASASFRQQQSFEYDAVGRLTSATGAYGGKRRYLWNERDQVTGELDALGRANALVYDDYGNLASLTEAANTPLARLHNTTTRIEYDLHGRPQAITVPSGARTKFFKDDFGRTIAVQSGDSGISTRRYNAANQLVASSDALGNRAEYAYELRGRITRQTMIGTDGSVQVTTWRYDGDKVMEVEHPNQGERYGYDADGRPVSKAVEVRTGGGARITALTRYTYGANGELSGVSLPDGSFVEYSRNAQGQVVGLLRYRGQTPWLRWLETPQQLASGIERDIVGIRRLVYGNGVRADFERSKQGVLARTRYWGKRKEAGTMLARLLGIETAHAAEPVTPLETRSYLWDGNGNLLQTRSAGATSSYAYDAQDRLIVAAERPAGKDQASYSRYFYDGVGNRLLAQENVAEQGEVKSNTVRSKYAAATNRWEGNVQVPVDYDAAGQPTQVAGRYYVWNAAGQLAEVRQNGKTLATYRYNHRGERIAKEVGGQRSYFLYEDRKLVAELNANGEVIRQYIYLGDEPLAIIDAHQVRLQDSKSTALARALRDVAIAVSSWFGAREEVYFLHNNHLGATELITDENGVPIWKASYNPFGKINTLLTAGAGRKLAYGLRLPGQYHDSETGLYYNDHRYYDPSQGRYLSPDPLGLRGGLNNYAYVGNNPLKYIDPSGLILFAFDGTNNSNPPPGVDDFSNVYKFYQAYDDGKKWYMNGVGRNDPDSGIQTNWLDDINANTARARVDYMLQQLDEYVTKTKFEQGEAVNIDIVGFSRGAAMSRDFTNRVATRLRANSYKDSGACVQIRFLGLWDTVAQFGLNGAANGSWQLAIPPEAKNVFHAVALNEHRYLFPGEAIGRGIQKGFIGSHADIGGSYGAGDLSDVALNWIAEQAKASGVKMINWGENRTNVEWGRVTNPMLHDKGSGGDRDFCLRDNNEAWADNCQEQKKATPGGMTWSQTQAGKFINIYSQSTMDADGSSKIVGEVNMKEYAAWLKQNYGLDIH